MSDEQKRTSVDQEVTDEISFHKEIIATKNQLKHQQGLNKILGESPAIHDLREKISKISDCDVSVLITGESGCGKELAARAIHYLSPRAGKPFIPIICGAIPETLFENELFGHAKGAFTDARFRQIGLLKEAEEGTVFLDEISATSLYIQVKLLRLLQDKEYRPLGDTKSQTARVRILAATNRDLYDLVKNGTFREDLYYRLKIVSLYIPPLRDRKDDIPLLVENFISNYAREYHKPAREISPEVMQTFLLHSWPGNVRELENKIQELVAISTSPVIRTDNAFSCLECQQKAAAKKLEPFHAAKTNVINSFESGYLVQLLKSSRGDVAEAARCAGKSRTSLWNLIKKHSICPKDFRS